METITAKDVINKKNEKFHLGLDLHGVLDAHPEKYIPLAHMVKRSGGRVTICTGSSNNKELRDELRRLAERVYKLYNATFENFYTDIFSVSDFIRSQYKEDTEYEEDFDSGGVWVSEDLWNRIKGDWAAMNNVTLHIDDRVDYKKHFPAGTFLLAGSRGDKNGR